MNNKEFDLIIEELNEKIHVLEILAKDKAFSCFAYDPTEKEIKDAYITYGKFLGTVDIRDAIYTLLIKNLI